MLTIDKINKLIGVTESFHASYKLMEIVNNKIEREKLFGLFLSEQQDLSFDWFTEYFQAEHSDRKGKKQDFTPDGIIRVANGVLGTTDSNADICAGTGGLTIKRYSENPNASFYCEEFSDRALPFLLFNLSIRNVDAIVCHGDSLTRDFKGIYQLIKAEKFSEIVMLKESPDIESETVIMNPPYSMSWNPEKGWIEQERFKAFEALAPKSKSDYAFLLQGLHQLKEYGVMSIILPHGVLFRGSAEGIIRKKLIEMNLLDAVIGLPAKAFLSTDIPTAVLVIKKNRTTKDILFIDASKEFTKYASQNVLEDKHISKILDTFNGRKQIDKFSKSISFDEISENDFNLNIPRYIDTFEPEKVESLDKIKNELAEIDIKIERSQQELSLMLDELVGTTPEADREIKEFAKFFSKRVNPLKNAKKASRGEQLTLL
ncbi:N-6 DNA methylase [Enterococcus sp.]|uniref:N-6 DNA methylase n=1 Tax=Enterococcus sp. TaxID=35783 RepID=UPI002FC5D172